MKNKLAAVDDPMLLTSTVDIKGKTYTLCFDTRALMKAEHDLREQGHDVNLQRSLPVLTLENTVIVFAAAVRRFHPEITFEAAIDLVTMRYFMAVGNAVLEAWNKCLAEPEEASAGPRKPEVR